MSWSRLQGRGYTLTVASLRLLVVCYQILWGINCGSTCWESHHIKTNKNWKTSRFYLVKYGTGRPAQPQVSDFSGFNYTVRTIPQETSELFWRGARPLSHLGLWTLAESDWGDLIRLPPHNHINKAGVLRQGALITAKCTCYMCPF